MTELVYQSLGPFCLLHDALLVVLANGSTEFIIIHGRAILPFTPKASDSHGVFDLEYSFGPVEPPDATAVEMRLAKQLLQKLPEMDVGVRPGASRSSDATFCVARFITDFIIRLHSFTAEIMRALR